MAKVFDGELSLGDIIQEYPNMIAFSLLLLIGYLIQGLLAGGFTSSSVFPYAKQLSLPVQVIVSPWFHAGPEKLFMNWIMIVPGCFFVERRSNPNHLFLYMSLSGYIANFLPPVIGMGGKGLGASGILYGLWANIGVFQFIKSTSAIAEGEYLRLALNLLLWIIGLFYILHGIGAYIGLVDAIPGVADAAHFVGVLIGGLWAIFQLGTDYWTNWNS